jgi:hypothetical protein
VLGTDALGRPIVYGEIYNPATTRTVTGTYGAYAGMPVIIRDPFPGNKFSAGTPLDPVAQKWQSFLPQPINSSPINNSFAMVPHTMITTIPTIKIDQNIGSKLKLSGSWSMTDIYVPWPTDALGPPDTTNFVMWETTHTTRINLDYTITPTVLLHLGGGYMPFSYIAGAPPGDTFNNLTTFGLPGTYYNAPPCISGLSQSGFGLGSGSSGQCALTRVLSEKPTATANLSWVKGNHTYKFGGELRVESYPALQVNPSNGAFTFSPLETALPYLGRINTVGSGTIGFSYASFLLGDVDSGAISQINDFHVGKHSFAFFAQDSWKVTRKLTIDYGLRYDFETYLQTNGMTPAFGFNTPNPNPNYSGLLGAATFEGYGPGKCNCSFASNYPYNFGPRLGIAYQITPKTVFRGGIGVTYGQTADYEMANYRLASSVAFGPNIFGTPISQLQNGPPIVPIWPNFDPAQIPATPFAANPNGVDPHAGYPPRLLMWSVGIQRELSKDISLEISYVGNRGAWWNSDGVLTDPNRVTPAILSAHNFDPTLANVANDMVLLEPFSALTPAQLAQFKLAPPYASFNGTVTQSLRPYPQFGGITLNWSPLGNTWYDALQARFTKRFSHGLSMTASYSFQKEEVVGTDAQTTAGGPWPPIINLNNLRANKSLSGLSQPHRFVMAGTYTTPRANVFKPLSWLMKDWAYGFYLVYASGLPTMAPEALNFPNPAQELSLASGISMFGNAGYMSRVPGVPLYTKDINSHWDPNTTFILNPAAWTAPPQGQFGTGSAYYNDYRNRRFPTENMNLGRVFRLREGMNLQLRVELMNVFNRVPIPTPWNQLFLPQTVVNGVPVMGFGYSNSATGAGQRTAQLVARWTF